jgi:hypothetical protein
MKKAVGSRRASKSWEALGHIFVNDGLLVQDTDRGKGKWYVRIDGLTEDELAPGSRRSGPRGPETLGPALEEGHHSLSSERL